MPEVTWGLIGNSGTDPKTNFLGTTDERPLVIRTNGNPVVTIDAEGKVGIGTDARNGPPSSTPEAALHVRLASNTEGNVVRIDDMFGVTTIGNGSLAIGGADGKTAVGLRTETGRGTLFSDGTLMLSAGFDVAIQSDPQPGQAGRVGIGLQTPQTTLHVQGDRIRLSGNQKQLDMRVDGGGVDLHTQSSDLFIRSNGPEGRNNVLINPFHNTLGDGNVGIGTTTPQAKLHVDGDLLVSGTKSFVQTHPVDPKKEIVYVALEGGEAGTYIRGTAKLVNGKAAIELPGHFGLITGDHGLTVQLTPRGEWLQIYVVQLDTRNLVVKEAQLKSGEFDYLIHGLRKGYEHHQPIRDIARAS